MGSKALAHGIRRWRLSAAIALSTALPLLLAGIGTAQAQDLETPQPPLEQPIEPATEEPPSLNALLTTFIPELPGLGEADDFLPQPEPMAQVSLVIRLSDRRVQVYRRGQLETSFPIAIGRSGWDTPTGQHKVIQMLQNPAWENPFTGEVIPPGPDNPLGVRWIGFWTDGRNYIGFHGTPNEESVGRAASHGCIRMYNRDVVKLFEMVRVGTPVTVVP